MGAVRHRPRRLESAVSICVLAVLFLIAAGVFIKQFNYDISRFGIQQQLDVSAGPIGVRLLPAGFEILSEAEVYNPENLYEKIDGKAPFYLESGFEKLLTQRFVNKARENLWMEIFVYDMGTTRRAFSVYSVQKRAEAEILPDMQFAYRTSNAVYFVHGKYYIELVGSSESDELFEAMAEVSRKTRANLPVDKVAGIAELSLFPSENIVAGSVKLYLKDAFGFEGLTDTFTARYRTDAETITAFLSRRASRQEAKRVAESYYKFLIDSGGTERTVPLAGKLPGKVIEVDGATEIVFAKGAFVAGVHEVENQQSALELTNLLFNKLIEASRAVRND